MSSVLRIALILLAAGCGPKLRADTSDQPNAAESTGRHSVVAVDGPTSPLIVDWNPEQRADLEEAIHDGVAVMAYDARGLKLLKGCNIAGDYGYLGVTTKTQVVRLESAEDVAVNLPLAGAGIAGKIGAEFGQGATLDIAMVMVGKQRTTWNNVSRADLAGGSKCEGATHYVRGVTIGAFAMVTGTKQKARAAAEIFGIGASAGSEKSAGVDNSDGKLEACETADPGLEKPPGQCAAILRVELEPIADASTAAAKPDVAADEVHGCAQGWVFAGGKCTREAKGVAHVCERSDVDDCATQCRQGDAQSCNHFGVLIERGKAPGDAKAAFAKGCEGGSASACGNLGSRLLMRDKKGAMAALQKACLQGHAHSCRVAAAEVFAGRGVEKNETKAIALYGAGCNGGDLQSCVDLAVIYSGAAKTVPPDSKKALFLFERACNGGLASACSTAGLQHEMGMGVPRSPESAVRLVARACELSSQECFRLAILHQNGSGVAQSDEHAKELFTRACKAGDGGLQQMSCFLASALFREPPPSVNEDRLAFTLDLVQPQCKSKIVRACSFVGAIQLAQGNKPKAAATLKKACKDKDAWACDLVERMAL
jgi:TPR repeat protein